MLRGGGQFPLAPNSNSKQNVSFYHEKYSKAKIIGELNRNALGTMPRRKP
jgi:hypothetical protein